MPFKGFNISYPTYTIITPQTGDQYGVRCLTVAEFNELRHSQLSTAKAATIINDIIWKVITKKPDHINNFKSFLANTTLIDRTALVYGVYNSTFGNDKEFGVSCQKCGNDQQIKFQLSNIFKSNPYPYSPSFVNSYKVAKVVEGEEDPTMEYVVNKVEQEQILNKKTAYDESKKQIEDIFKKENINFVEDEVIESKGLSGFSGKSGYSQDSIEEKAKKPSIMSILEKKLEVELPISKVIAVIRQPSLLHEDESLKNSPYADVKAITLISETLVLDKLYKRYPDGSIMEAVHLDEILFGYKELPIDDKAEIFKAYQDNFGQYCIDLTANWNCVSCGFGNKMELDIVNQFFRVVSTLG